MNKETHTISVVTRLQDCGDGGWTMYIYNNEEELLKDHPLSSKWDTKLKRDVEVELTEQEKKDILNEDDPYRNGYIGHDSIEIELVDGKARLAKELSLHVGQ